MTNITVKGAKRIRLRNSSDYAYILKMKFSFKTLLGAVPRGARLVSKVIAPGVSVKK